MEIFKRMAAIFTPGSGAKWSVLGCPGGHCRNLVLETKAMGIAWHRDIFIGVFIILLGRTPLVRAKASGKLGF